MTSRSRRKRTGRTDSPLVAPEDLVLADHLREVRGRLTWPFITFSLAALTCYLNYNSIFPILQRPLHAPLYFTSPQGGFSVLMGICLAAGLIGAIPLLVYHLLMFLRPAFPRLIKRNVTIIVALLSSVLACSGACFALLVILPLVLHFFTGFQTAGLSALITASSYFDLLTKLLVTFALIFQLPLILWTSNRIKPLSPQRLLRSEKYVIAGSVGVAVLVPFAFDLATQAMIAIPIIALYNLSILIVVIDNRFRRHEPQPQPQRPNQLTTTPQPHAESRHAARAPAVPISERRPSLISPTRPTLASRDVQPPKGLPRRSDGQLRPNAMRSQNAPKQPGNPAAGRATGLISEFIK